MGCICSKGIGIFIPQQPARQSKNGTTVQNSQRNNEYVLSRSFSKTRENASVLPQLAIFEGKNNVPVPIIIDGQLPPPQRSLSAVIHNHRAPLTSIVADIGRSFDLETQLDSTGWPSWLTSVAGDAIRGLVPRRADSFIRFDKVIQRICLSIVILLLLLLLVFLLKYADWTRNIQ